MTDLTTQIAELREIVGRMTPGECRADPMMGDCSIVAGRRLIASTGGFQSSSEITAPQNAANAAGIVALRNTALPIIEALTAENATLRAELDEQARVNGMGGEREARHLARIAELEAEVARLREEANISATMQEKVRSAIAAIGGNHE